MNDEVLEFDSDSFQSKERTGLLTTACVLSWIMGGLMVLVCALMFLMKGLLERVLEENPERLDSQSRAALEMVMANFDMIFLGYLVAYVISIVSVVMMYRLKKIGFYIYAPLHIGITFFPYTYQPFVIDGNAIFSFVVLGTFLTFYGSNLKHMN
jgi:hypothetical protein